MNWKKVVTAYGVHCAGEVGRVVTGGVMNLPGKTLIDKIVYINTVDDSLLRFLVFEPRGCSAGSTNLLLPPTHPDADAAFIILQPGGAYPLSGSNSMCVVTALLETGIVPCVEGWSTITLETGVGLIPAEVEVRNGRVERCQLNMAPSFVLHLDHPLKLDSGQGISVDIAFGGCFYALVDAATLGLEIIAKNARKLAEIGQIIKNAVVEQIPLQHSEIAALNKVDYVMFTNIVDREKGIFRNCTIVPPGRADRSPCGTGSSARMAVMYARGELEIGRKLEMRSIIDSCFNTEVAGLTTVGSYPAILPKVAGSSWIYSIEQLGVSDTDPYPLGFALSDTWGPDI
ncbi:MAG: proline racemase family protein [Desulfobulbaceae bacterium]|nr:proline racemase family protein [Desulfobulbaceae bacterium]